MSVKSFFDTNILVYAFDENEPKKSKIAKQLIQEFGNEGTLIISTQVLQEFYVTLTRVGKNLLNKEAAEEVIQDFSEFPLIQVDKNIILNAMKRHQTNAFSFWDSLIVEAALQSGCTQLLSEDMLDGLIIDSMTIRNPFKDL